MLASLRNIFRVPDLRNKVLFTLFMIALYRFGAYIPVPGIDVDARSRRSKRQAEQGGVLGFLQLFSGGALTQFAIFALGIMPYITASIIMQILARGDPQARGVAEPGRGRPAQDHPVDPLRHHRHRRRAVHRPRLPVPQRRRRASAAATPPASTCVPNFDVRPRAAHRAHPHRRHRPADVDGRAHHPAGHRQRHVAADLRLGRSARCPSQGSQIKADGRQRRPDRHARSCSSSSWWPSCSSSRASAASRCSSPSGWSAAACTAARAPTSRSRSTSPA